MPPVSMMNVWLSDIHTPMATIGWGDQFRPALPLFLLHPPRPFFAFFRPRCLTGSVDWQLVVQWGYQERLGGGGSAGCWNSERRRKRAWSLIMKAKEVGGTWHALARFALLVKCCHEITTLLSLRHFALLVKCCLRSLPYYHCDILLY